MNELDDTLRFIENLKKCAKEPYKVIFYDQENLTEKNKMRNYLIISHLTGFDFHYEDFLESYAKSKAILLEIHTFNETEYYSVMNNIKTCQKMQNPEDYIETSKLIKLNKILFFEVDDEEDYDEWRGNVSKLVKDKPETNILYKNRI